MEKLKNIFDHHFISMLGQSLSKHSKSTFDIDHFENIVFQKDWNQLEFKQRVRRISTAMYETLPKEYEDALKVLHEVAPHFEGLAGIIFPDYVELYGRNDWDLSMKALEEFTKFSTSEFAIRPFLLMDEKKVLEQVFIWMKSQNEHVRRFASEGCRPKLPWGQSVPSFKKNPFPLIPMLENLIEDESIYVRKSVANHLNDISKTHPHIIIDLIKKWLGKNERTDWILRHASRTLLKQGNKDVLQLFGYETSEFIHVDELNLSTKSITIGDQLHFCFTITTDSTTKIRLEYAIDYVKKNGKRNKKTFKISESTINQGHSKKYDKRQSFKNMTTRTHYPGLHTLSIIVNGAVKNSINFNLRK
ncbi:DNA alkylation repair protein [Salipaludibacillus daqingensis]|uniref:DNA alkylation repair protein n=1 Tax=Salipaludibacillus daqingensis TaxID=3041001 RepID=UPI0024760772|nr:DNA alkylation repair protein [Salipaludibacillus daqingensis]